MYVLIDREHMNVMRKHRTQQVLSDLAVIEGAYVPTVICEVTVDDFVALFTDYELKRLYKAVTLKELPSVWSDAIIRAAVRVVEQLPEDEINSILANSQALYAFANDVDDEDEHINYRYKAASTTPERLLDLKTPLPRSCDVPADWQSGFIASLPATATLRRATVTERLADTVPVATPTQRQPAASRPAGQNVGTRGASVTIFQVADEMWEKAGKPTDLSVVLLLRKTMMTELETNYGIKKTTSSTALGQWQKLRVS